MAKKKFSKKTAPSRDPKEEDVPKASGEKASAATKDSESALERVTDPKLAAKPKSEAPATKGELPKAPTLDQVKEFVAGGGTLPPNLIAAEHNVAGGRMVKLKGLAAGQGHPKIVIPS